LPIWAGAWEELRRAAGNRPHCLSRVGAHAGLVTLRRTFVRRCHGDIGKTRRLTTAELASQTHDEA